MPVRAITLYQTALTTIDKMKCHPSLLQQAQIFQINHSQTHMQSGQLTIDLSDASHEDQVNLLEIGNEEIVSNTSSRSRLESDSTKVSKLKGEYFATYGRSARGNLASNPTWLRQQLQKHKDSAALRAPGQEGILSDAASMASATSAEISNLQFASFANSSAAWTA